MSHANRQLAQRWMQEVWNERREATVDELLPAHAVGHAADASRIRGPAEFRAYRDAFLGAFPDLRMDVLATVAEGDDVVVRWRVRGAHHGDGLGFPATGKPVDFGGMTWLRFQGGRLVEGWDAWNQDGLIRHLQGGAPAA